MMRVSLYKHELEVVERLTVSLTRMCRDESLDLKPQITGPEIFAKLLDALYARGNYKYGSAASYATEGAPFHIENFQEVDASTLWTCPRCHNLGFPSAIQPIGVCTACANRENCI